jgi:hypothetical protein
MTAMEFSYTISEAEYLRARKLPSKSPAQIISLATRANFLFWLFLFVLLVILWTFVNLISRPPQSQRVSAHPHPAGLLGSLIVCPISVAIFCIFAFLFFGIGPLRARRQYRKDPFLQGQSTVDLNAQWISIRNSAGASSQHVWNLYLYWRERKNLIVLVRPSREFLILNLAALSDPQRTQLRSILAAALPQK